MLIDASPIVGPRSRGSLRDASYKGAARLGHGKGYPYPHNFPGHHVPQQYLPAALKDRRFYTPSDEGYEAEVKARVERWRSAGDKGGANSCVSISALWCRLLRIQT